MRPKPKILFEWIDSKTYTAYQVLEADAVYAVFFKGSPINLRKLLTLVNYPGPKYPRVAYMSPGHCFNLCQQLNRSFGPGFEVYRLTAGESVTGNDDYE
jgi:hypothetical protein